MKKFSDVLMLCIIVMIILVPVAHFNLKPGQISSVENRVLAELVPITDGAEEFMNSLDDVVNDRIGYRDQMMSFYNKVMYAGLKGNHKDVIVGDDGWLFYKEDLTTYTGNGNNPEKTEYQVRVLKAIDKWCDERGITFIFAVGPNKSTIYNNYMPDSIICTEKTQAELVAEALEGSGVNFVYPKAEMIADRDKQELFYRLDTHWNEYGARYMLDDIVDILDLPQREFVMTEDKTAGGDLIHMLGAGANGSYSVLVNVEANEGTKYDPEGYEALEYKDFYMYTEGTEEFICYRDSFHFALLDYYSYYFHGPLYWKYDIDFDYVEQELPKYLIVSCVERNFEHAIWQNSGILG